MSSVANNGECASASVNRLRPVAGEGVLRAAIELLLLPPACTVPRASVASPTARGDACNAAGLLRGRMRWRMGCAT
ncbi:hypothetical protein HZS91_02086 [Xanthomonas citri pv. citri]|nr:hypothetical protein HZS91_02086 [Xanthomonas citri pv. citri]